MFCRVEVGAEACIRIPHHPSQIAELACSHRDSSCTTAPSATLFACSVHPLRPPSSAALQTAVLNWENYEGVPQQGGPGDEIPPTTITTPAGGSVTLTFDSNWAIIQPDGTEPGFSKAVVSAKTVAYNYDVGPATMTSSAPFFLRSLWLTSASCKLAVVRFEGTPVNGNDPISSYSPATDSNSTQLIFKQLDSSWDQPLTSFSMEAVSGYCCSEYCYDGPANYYKAAVDDIVLDILYTAA